MKKYIFCVLIALFLIPTPVFAQETMNYEKWQDLIPYIESLEKRIEELESGNKSEEPIKTQRSGDIQTAEQSSDIYETVEFKDQTITLNEYKITGNSLVLSFTVVNTGNKSIIVSSFISFSAKNDDGEKLELDWLANGSTSLDGTILPNDKLKGNVVFTISGEGPFKIIYNPELWGNDYASWDIK